jgi:hypothetical protein
MAIYNQYYGEVIARAMNIQKRDIAVPVQCSPTDKLKAHHHGVYPDTHRESTEMSTNKFSKTTKMVLQPHIERETMKSTAWSRKWTLEDHCHIMIHLRVNDES